METLGTRLAELSRWPPFRARGDQMRKLTAAVLIVVFGLASTASAQTIRESASNAAVAAAAQANGRTELNKPLWYGGAALLGAGIGLVIGAAFNGSNCDDYRGFGIA